MRIDGSRNAADEKRTTQPGQTPAVIDWEYTALGDPAYDLAIVMRGARRPFQMDRGLDRLLEAYRGARGPFITARDVHFYEVCIAAGWVCDAMASDDQAIATHSALRKVCCAESARCEDHSAAGWVSGYVSPGLSADEAS